MICAGLAIYLSAFFLWSSRFLPGSLAWRRTLKAYQKPPKTAKYNNIVYLHTYGMSYAHNRRDRIEKVLTRFTFSDWRKVLQVFETHPHVNKIGMFPGD